MTSLAGVSQGEHERDDVVRLAVMLKLTLEAASHVATASARNVPLPITHAIPSSSMEQVTPMRSPCRVLHHGVMKPITNLQVETLERAGFATGYCAIPTLLG